MQFVNRKKLFHAVAAVTFGMSGAETARAVVPEYNILDLRTLGGDWSYGQAINTLGQVVGSAATKNGNNSPTRAMLYSGSTMYNLRVLNSADDSFSYGINSTGRVVGYSGDSNGAYADGFLWT